MNSNEPPRAAVGSTGSTEMGALEPLEDVWLPGPEVCRRLTIERSTLTRWRRQGLASIGAGKLLRYHWPACLAWLKSMKAPR